MPDADRRPRLLEQAVQRTAARGGTALTTRSTSRCSSSARAAQQDGEVRRQAIALLTDGEDTSSLVSFDDVLGWRGRAGVNIYTIALQSRYAAARAVDRRQRRFFSQAEFSMKTLAQETGAQAFFPCRSSS